MLGVISARGWLLLQSSDISIIEELIPSGTGEQSHLHHFSRQYFYILKCIAIFLIEEDFCGLNREKEYVLNQN